MLSRIAIILFCLNFFCVNVFSLAVFAEDNIVLQGSVERVVPSGTNVKLKILSLPMAKGYLENWDLEGGFIPPKEGDPIVSELTEPVYVGADLVLPKHTQFLGRVSRVIAPKHFGKDGRIEVSFHALKTPSGKYLQFAQPQNTLQLEANRKQQMIKGATRLGAYAAGGAAAGALGAGYLSGLILTATKPEYILGGGAVVGLLVGLVVAVVKKGQAGRLMPGDEIQINLEQNVVMPVAEPIAEQAPEAFAVTGLNLNIYKKKLLQDELGKAVLVLDIEVINHTNKTLFGNDFLLYGPYNRVIYPGGLSIQSMDQGSELLDNFSLKQIRPGEQMKSQVAFEIDFPGFEHLLALRERSSQKIVYKASVGHPADYQPQQKRGQRWKQKIFGQSSDPWK